MEWRCGWWWQKVELFEGHLREGRILEKKVEEMGKNVGLEIERKGKKELRRKINNWIMGEGIELGKKSNIAVYERKGKLRGG